MRWYVSLFDGASIARIDRWGEGEPGEADKLKFAAFSLAGRAMRRFPLVLFSRCRLQIEQWRLHANARAPWVGRETRSHDGTRRIVHIRRSSRRMVVAGSTPSSSQGAA